MGAARPVAQEADKMRWRLTRGSHRHADATSAKPPAKTIRWPKSDGFDSWVAKDTRFCNSMAKTKPRPELNG